MALLTILLASSLLHVPAQSPCEVGLEVLILDLCVINSSPPPP